VKGSQSRKLFLPESRSYFGSDPFSLIAAGSDSVGSTPEEFLAFVKSELARWGKVIHENNIRAE
jgi:hypothetical protein